MAPEPGTYVKRPDPEAAAAEEEAWGRLLDDFDNDALHKQYMGLCIRNGLLLQASRRYGAYAEDKENNPVDRRRIARRNQEQMAGILFLKPKDAGLRPSREGAFGTLSYLELFGLLAGVLVGVAGLIFGGWLLFLMPLAVIVVGGILYSKIKAVGDQLSNDK